MNQALYFAALWVSECWYEAWRDEGRLHSKARGIVVFDRVLNGEIQ
ncbi:hypothetical protein [Variovorax sp. RO1]|nr:hypothetical protein [Variovorax sp. RO1]